MKCGGRRQRQALLPVSLPRHPRPHLCRSCFPAHLGEPRDPVSQMTRGPKVPRVLPAFPASGEGALSFLCGAVVVFCFSVLAFSLGAFSSLLLPVLPGWRMRAHKPKEAARRTFTKGTKAAMPPKKSEPKERKNNFFPAMCDYYFLSNSSCS